MTRTAEVAAQLSDSYLFDGIPMVDVATWAQVATTRRLIGGKRLWHPGDPASEVYVMHSGEVKDFSSTRTELRSFTSCTGPR